MNKDKLKKISGWIGLIVWGINIFILFPAILFLSIYAFFFISTPNQATL
jgi:hypothetical protein